MTYIISGDTKNNIGEFEFYWHLPLPSSGATIDVKTHVGGVIKIVNNSKLIEQNILFEPWGKLPRKIKKNSMENSTLLSTIRLAFVKILHDESA